MKPRWVGPDELHASLLDRWRYEHGGNCSILSTIDPEDPYGTVLAEAGTLVRIAGGLAPALAAAAEVRRRRLAMVRCRRDG